jgi:ASCH domain
MKAISIRQPWAWLIVNGHKDVENRSWSTKHRGQILIHASKVMTRLDFAQCHRFALARGVTLPRFEELERGGLIGTALLVDCLTTSDSPWYAPAHDQLGYGFLLAQPKSIPFVERSGALGFFECHWTAA